MAICIYNIIVHLEALETKRMKKIIQSVEPTVIAASGVDVEALAQANLSEEKDIQQLLGEEHETKNSVRGNARNN